MHCQWRLLLQKFHKALHNGLAEGGTGRRPLVLSKEIPWTKKVSPTPGSMEKFWSGKKAEREWNRKGKDGDRGGDGQIRHGRGMCWLKKVQPDPILPGHDLPMQGHLDLHQQCCWWLRGFPWGKRTNAPLSKEELQKPSPTLNAVNAALAPLD